MEIDAVVLDQAAQPMPTELGTFDAIHLATALLWKEMIRSDLAMSVLPDVPRRNRQRAQDRAGWLAFRPISSEYHR